MFSRLLAARETTFCLGSQQLVARVEVCKVSRYLSRGFNAEWFVVAFHGCASGVPKMWNVEPRHMHADIGLHEVLESGASGAHLPVIFRILSKLAVIGSM